MTNIAEFRDRCIVFFGGNFKAITQSQENALYSPQATAAGGCRIDGDFIALSGIARTCLLKEFFDQNPNKRPAPEYPRHEGKLLAPGSWKETKRKSGIESMIRGMKKYIASDRYQGGKAPLEFIEKMEKRLATEKLESV